MTNIFSGLVNLPHLDQWVFNLMDIDNGGYALYVFVTTLFATLVSGLIGFEREKKGHAAGLRTHIMVSIGSSLIMNVSVIGTRIYGGDPFRLAAQVVSGIGFLGAGTIMQTSFDIKGLTTASTLWLSGGLGLCCGAGLVSEALIVAFISISALLLLGVYEIASSKKNTKIVLIAKSESRCLGNVSEMADKLNLFIRDVETTFITYKHVQCVKIVLNFDKNADVFKLKILAEQIKETFDPLELKLDLLEKKSRRK